MCTINNHDDIPIELIIVDKVWKPILELKTCSELGIIQSVGCVNSEKPNKSDSYKEVFNGSVKFPGESYKIVLKNENANLIVYPSNQSSPVNQSKI